MERMKTAVAKHSSEEDSDSDRGEGGVVKETEELLSAVLSAHLVLFRLGFLFLWQGPSKPDKKTSFRGDIQRLAGVLVDGWDLLGVSGEARRGMLRRVMVEVGQQTLETRQRIDRDLDKQLESDPSAAGGLRASAALRETEGEDYGACPGLPAFIGSAV